MKNYKAQWKDKPFDPMGFIGSFEGPVRVILRSEDGVLSVAPLSEVTMICINNDPLEPVRTVNSTKKTLKS